MTPGRPVNLPDHYGHLSAWLGGSWDDPKCQSWDDLRCQNWDDPRCQSWDDPRCQSWQPHRTGAPRGKSSERRARGEQSRALEGSEPRVAHASRLRRRPVPAPAPGRLVQVLCSQADWDGNGTDGPLIWTVGGGR